MDSTDVMCKGSRLPWNKSDTNYRFKFCLGPGNRAERSVNQVSRFSSFVCAR